MLDTFVPWPDEAAERYVVEGYWLGVPLGRHLWQRAERWPDRAALVDGHGPLTYREMMEHADVVAARLRDRGWKPGETVLLQATNRAAFMVLFVACLRLGVVPIMVLPTHRRHELEHLARQAGAMALIVPDVVRGFDHRSLAATVREAVPSVRDIVVVGDRRADDGPLCYSNLADLAGAPPIDELRDEFDAVALSSREVAVILLSGGTTGLPKLIPRTHDDYEYNARRSGEVCAFTDTTVYMVTLPMGHNFPLACPGILGTLLVGGQVVFAESSEVQSALATIRQHSVSVTAVVPTVAQRWLEAVESGTAPAPPSLEVLQVGGARLAPDVARRVMTALGCNVQQVFGMAEGLLNYTRLEDPVDAICETQGRPISPDDEIRIVDDHDRDVRFGEPGSLLTRGPYTLRGYLWATEHNQRAFTDDGWYRTGDVVRWDSTGNLTVLGRTKDLINRGGEKISAEEVEDLLYSVAPVTAAAAVAMPDADLGERICVYAVPRTGATLELEQIRDALDALGVARFKHPERLELVEALPVTSVGKIDKQALREDIATKLVQ